MLMKEGEGCRQEGFYGAGLGDSLRKPHRLSERESAALPLHFSFAMSQSQFVTNVSVCMTQHALYLHCTANGNSANCWTILSRNENVIHTTLPLGVALNTSSSTTGNCKPQVLRASHVCSALCQSYGTNTLRPARLGIDSRGVRVSYD